MPHVHTLICGFAYVMAGVLVGALLFLIGQPAFAQDYQGPITSVPGFPAQPSVPRARLIVHSQGMLLLGFDGRLRFELADEGTIEFSEFATVDFSPMMRAQRYGPLVDAVRVRVGGKSFVVPLYEDLDLVPEIPR